MAMIKIIRCSTEDQYFNVIDHFREQYEVDYQSKSLSIDEFHEYIIYVDKVFIKEGFNNYFLSVKVSDDPKIDILRDRSTVKYEYIELQ